MRDFPTYCFTEENGDMPPAFGDVMLINSPLTHALSLTSFYRVLQTQDIANALWYASAYFEQSLQSPESLEKFILDVHHKLGLHALMLHPKGVQSKAGIYRNDIIVDGEDKARELGSPVDEIQPQMHALCESLIETYRSLTQEDSEKLTDDTILLLATHMLTEICRIHPFFNGNGRVARILMNCIILQFSDLSPIVFSDKDAYYEAVRLYVHEDNKEPLTNMVHSFSLEEKFNTTPFVIPSSFEITLPNGQTFKFNSDNSIDFIPIPNSSDCICLNKNVLSKILRYSDDIPEAVTDFLRRVIKSRWSNKKNLASLQQGSVLAIKNLYRDAMAAYKDKKYDTAADLSMDAAKTIIQLSKSGVVNGKFHQFCYIAAMSSDKLTDIKTEEAQLHRKNSIMCIELAIKHAKSPAAIEKYNEKKQAFEEKRQEFEEKLSATTNNTESNNCAV